MSPLYLVRDNQACNICVQLQAVRALFITVHLF